MSKKEQINIANEILQSYLENFKEFDKKYYLHIKKRLEDNNFRKNMLIAILTCTESFRTALYNKVWNLEKELKILKQLIRDSDIKFIIKNFFNHVKFEDFYDNFPLDKLLQKSIEFNDFKKQVGVFLTLNDK